VGNLHLRFDEGRVGRAQASPSLLLYHPGPSKRTRRKERALLIVRDEFRPAISSIGLLASIARLRFTDTGSITRTLSPARLNRTFLLCRE